MECRCRGMEAHGSRWGLMYVLVRTGGRWETQKRRAACVWRDLRVGGVLVWAGVAVRWGEYCWRRAE